MITFVATCFRETTEAYLFCSSLILQTNPNWRAIIYCNGPNQFVHDVIEHIGDKRISYEQSKINSGFWGCYNRIAALDIVNTGFIIQTSIQDYYLPCAVEEILKFNYKYLIYFNCIHNHYGPHEFKSKLREGYIDWGSFCIDTKLAKQIGIRNPKSPTADGLFIQDCMRYGNIDEGMHYIDKILTIHN